MSSTVERSAAVKQMSASYTAGETSRPDKKRKINNKDEVQESEGPACQNCRKKKSACSRTQPCSACLRYDVECVYNEQRTKPGVRTGVMESLSQRMVALEQMFLGQGLLWQQMWETMHPAVNGSNEEPHNASQLKTDLENSISRLRSGLSAVASRDTSSSENGNSSTVSQGEVKQALGPNLSAVDETSLPPEDLIDSLVDIYFVHIHHWIPMLHVCHFKERMKIPTERRKNSTILYAITSLCTRFSDDPRLGDPVQRTRYASKCRQIVILRSMESFSVENLQALTICAFDLIGGGRGPSAWSIVGSMTRTVEQLQLSVEDDDQEQSPAKILLKRMNFLPPCKTWSETEERRRVFWNIFIMDRFCSIATGWNFSLTSADMKRRLPCEGGLWERAQPLDIATPYFGIADQAGRVPAVSTARTEGDGQELLGGFAFAIEATESLSLVTSFFLQHELDISDPHQVQVWLMRFKELDLRLIQWKIFLPERWREACVLNDDGNMDPNLTLAHMTHNTAVILLHQVIAFPLPEWQNSRMRLPSASSTETCLAAATEVAIIAQEFLQRSSSLTNPQFAFCLFICGRLLLTYSSYRGEPLADAFDSLVASLVQTSKHWNGPYAVPDVETHNLASKFATRLMTARQQGQGTLDIREPVFSDHQYVEKPHGEQPNQTSFHLERNQAENPEGSSMDTTSLSDLYETSPDSISMAFPPLPLAFQGHIPYTNPSTPHATQTLPTGPGIQYDNPNTMPAEAMADGYEGIDAFLDPFFLPDQRVSVFSYTQNA